MEQPTTSTQSSIKKLFPAKRSEILENCVNLAISGISFSKFDHPDMQNILKKAETSTDISAAKVREGVQAKASEIRSRMKEKLKGRRLSLSADFGNKNGVDFFGIF